MLVVLVKDHSAARSLKVCRGDATAAALEGDRDCRERVFNKMFDKLNSPSDKNSTLPKADKLIATIDLGYDLQNVFQKIDELCSYKYKYLD